MDNCKVCGGSTDTEWWSFEGFCSHRCQLKYYKERYGVDLNNPDYSNSTASRQPTEVTILNGYHRYTYADGSTYDGEWKDDKGHGQGTLTWADGNKYEGEWKDGKKHGQGTYNYPDGST